MPRGKKKIEEPKKESWSPKPDMGEVKPPSASESKCTNCDHKKAIHYGPVKDWCNTKDCQCQGFK